MICLRNLFSFLELKAFRFFEKLPIFLQRRLILKSGLFDRTFACPTWMEVEDQVQWYLNQTRNTTTGRKPMPGFHPGIYTEHVNTGDVDPFVHFLKRGQPKGPWLFKVIAPVDQCSVKNHTWNGQCALHIHLHYYEQAEGILKALSYLKKVPELKISVTSNEGESHVLGLLEKERSLEADVRIVPNRGRDIGPFLTEFGRDLRKYKVIGHIHAKKTVLLNDDCMVERWIYFLFENLLAGRSPMADVILDHFERIPCLGLVFPDDPHDVGWTQNRLEAESLALRMGMPIPLPAQINFPVGTMFWSRPEALAPLFDLNLAWDDYPPEPLGYDGTMLHAIERLLPLIAIHAGYECAVTHVPGVSR